MLYGHTPLSLHRVEVVTILAQLGARSSFDKKIRPTEMAGLIIRLEKAGVTYEMLNDLYDYAYGIDLTARNIVESWDSEEGDVLDISLTQIPVDGASGTKPQAAELKLLGAYAELSKVANIRSYKALTAGAPKGKKKGTWSPYADGEASVQGVGAAGQVDPYQLAENPGIGELVARIFNQMHPHAIYRIQLWLKNEETNEYKTGSLDPSKWPDSVRKTGPAEHLPVDGEWFRDMKGGPEALKALVSVKTADLLRRYSGETGGPASGNPLDEGQGYELILKMKKVVPQEEYDILTKDQKKGVRQTAERATNLALKNLYQGPAPFQNTFQKNAAAAMEGKDKTSWMGIPVGKVAGKKLVAKQGFKPFVIKKPLKPFNADKRSRGFDQFED